MYLDLGRCMDNRICMVLEWTPEEARINLLCISREHHGRLRMGDSEPPDILYETCACVIHLQLHVHTPRSIFLSLLNTSEKIGIASDTQSKRKPPVTGYPRTKEQES